MISGRSRDLLAAAAVLALASLGGCARDLSDMDTVVDLAAELPIAETYREHGDIDVGSRSGEASLVWGWSWNEHEPSEDGGQTTYAWGVGSASTVRVYLVNRRDLKLVLRGRPGPPDPAGRQEVTVSVDGETVDRIELLPRSAGWQDYPVAVPREVLHAGWNTVELGYAHAVEPKSEGLSGDQRALAVAWDRISVEPAAGGARGPERVAAGKRQALRLPLGTEAVYYARLPPGSLLAFDGLRSSGTDARLVVQLQWEGEEAHDLANLHPSGKRRTLELPRERGDEASGSGHGEDGTTWRLARLSLRAVPTAWLEGRDGRAKGALELVAPRVLAPRSAAPQAREAATAPSPATPPDVAGLPNVLVYLIDTLRADHVGAYDPAAAERGLTPSIDAFAQGAVVFEDALTQAPWTRPAVASLLTGRPPLAHGVTGLDSRLPRSALTLPEVLRDLPGGGYRTAAWSTSWHVIRKTGFAQGFDDFRFFPDSPRPGVVNRSVASWLDRYLAGANDGPRRPFFLYVHAIDPHAPYRPPRELWRRFAPEVKNPQAGTNAYLKRVYGAKGEERARLMAALPPLYDAEVALADRGFGQLLAALEARGLRENTLIVLLSDHGEELDEHGNLGHGADLYQEVLRIPLIVDLPGHPAGREAGTALPMDVPATVLAALGVPRPSPMEGVDLLAADRDRRGDAERPAFAHLDYQRRAGVSVVLGHFQLIEPLTSRFAKGPELYDLERDPGEHENLAESHPVRAGYLRMLVRRHLLAMRGAANGESAELGPEERAGLEALGYL